MNAEDKNNNQNEQEQEEKEIVKDDKYYYHIMNPATGMRYDIPMLSPLDPDYYFQYVHAMKIRETSPDTFKRIMSWD